MALRETVGFFMGKKLLTPSHQLLFNGPWKPASLFQKPNFCQTRFFRGKGKGLGPNVEVVRIGESNSKGFLKPIAFTVGVCTCSFAGAAIWQYETARKRARFTWERSVNYFKDQWDFQRKIGNWRNEINTYWKRLSDGERLSIGLIGLNSIVFLLWRNPRLHPIMTKYFCSTSVGKTICWPMLLSTFSHYSGWHIFINMYVLYSFSTGLTNVLGREQFLAMYLSAGVVSSLSSYIFKVLTAKPGLSLGASGCLMGVLGFFCIQFPDAQLGIVFLPMFTFSASMALKGLIAVDTLGILLGWKLFDHAAHLGGVGFGILYALWGRQHIWEAREPFLRWWNDVRGSPYK